MLKIKRSEVIPIWNTLYKLKNVGDKSLTFYIQRNLIFLEDEVKSIVALQESGTPSEKYIEYDTKRLELGRYYSTKDENGEPTFKDLKFIFTEKNQKAWNDAFRDLTTEYKDIIIEQDKTVNELNRLLIEEIEIEFQKIPFVLIPEEINYSEISKIVKETPEEVEKLILDNINYKDKDITNGSEINPVTVN
jgi:hypothetical protein